MQLFVLCIKIFIHLVNEQYFNKILRRHTFFHSKKWQPFEKFFQMVSHTSKSSWTYRSCGLNEYVISDESIPQIRNEKAILIDIQKTELARNLSLIDKVNCNQMTCNSIKSLLSGIYFIVFVQTKL